jgi:hypothetical protein
MIRAASLLPPSLLMYDHACCVYRIHFTVQETRSASSTTKSNLHSRGA